MNRHWELLLAGTLALLPRLALIAFAADFPGDADVYGRVASNILHNLCVSLSDPVAGTCLPHAGGNQLPGYPAFVAFAWSISDGWRLAPLVGQAMIFAGAVVYLVHSLRSAGVARLSRLAVIAVASFSPTIAGWPRLQFTETLAIAAVLWTIALMVRSHSERGIRVVELGGAIAAGVFFRVACALLVVPVFVMARRFGRPGLLAVVAAITMALAPVGVWSLRNVGAGLSALPPSAQSSTGAPALVGAVAWLTTWVYSEAHLQRSVWPVLGSRPSSAWVPEQQSDAIKPLLLGLESQDAQERAAADRALWAFSRDVRASEPVRQFVVLPLFRATLLWLSPMPSLGLPAEVPPEARAAFLDALAGRDRRRVLAVVRANISDVLAKLIVATWRYLTVGVLIVASIRYWRFRDESADSALFASLTWAAWAYAAVATASLMFRPFIEARYLVPVFAWFEVSAALWLGLWLERRGNN